MIFMLMVMFSRMIKCCSRVYIIGMLWAGILSDFLQNCVCMRAHVRVYMWVLCPGKQRHQAPLELEFQVMVSCLLLMLRTEFRFSGQAPYAFTCWAISPSPHGKLLIEFIYRTISAIKLTCHSENKHSKHTSSIEFFNFFFYSSPALVWMTD